MISRRVLEVATALVTGAFGLAVVVSSFDNGIGWSSSGVESGTFPLLTGTIVLAGSLYNLVHGWLRGTGIAIRRIDFRRSAALLLPALAYVAFIPLAGLYPATALYLFGTLRFQSRLSVVRALAIALLTAILLYVVFERLFQIALPHGLLGAALDL
ncbi:tripartite tricarboxylate transporter TctB family protein [soil metagenome]